MKSNDEKIADLYEEFSVIIGMLGEAKAKMNILENQMSEYKKNRDSYLCSVEEDSSSFCNRIKSSLDKIIEDVNKYTCRLEEIDGELEVLEID